MPRHTGEYVITAAAGEQVRAFVPSPLPPARPPLLIDGGIERLHDEACSALDRLSIAAEMVPSMNWFLYGFVRKEAVLTSQIEGTQATLRDVLTFEATRESNRPDDVEEVCNYVNGLTYARRELNQPKGLSISTRLLCEAHKRLMKGARGGDKQPGTIRKVQHWIGGTRPSNAHFVPPPPDQVPAAMTELERWIHSDDPLPPLIRTGLAHVQFETIHPFLDGNGRIGRLLISLLLEHWHLTRSPTLYLSLAFKRHQREYYNRLSAVRTDGDWEGWTAFFLECVREAADDGVQAARRLFELVDAHRRRVAAHGRTTVVAIRLLDMLPEHPVVTVGRAGGLLNVTPPAARKAIDILSELNVIQETTGKQRDRVFAYHEYLQILEGDDA